MKEVTVKLIALIVMSLVMKTFISENVRNKLTPYAFAYCLIAPTLGMLVQGLSAATVVLVALGYLGKAFLLDGMQIKWCRGNSTLWMFVFFWMYMVFSMLFGKYSGYAVMYYMNTLVDSILVGYFVGVRILRYPDLWGRFIRIVSVAPFVCLLFYLRHGIFSADVASDYGDGRATVTIDVRGEMLASNQNYIGLLVAALLPYPFLLILGRHVWDIRHRWLKVVAYITFVLMAVALIRTGSRNACLGLLPVLCYLFFAKTALKRSQKIALRVTIVVFMFVTLAFTSGAFDKLRIFTATAESGDITSGRFDMFMHRLYGSTEGENWFGRGGLFDYRFIEELGLSCPPMSNGHSMYFQVYYQSGIVGSVLFFLAMLAVCLRARKLGARGHIILMLFFLWALCGVAESLPLLQESIFKPLVGIALAFCTKLQLPGLSQFEGGSGVSPHPPYPYPPPYPPPLPYYG